MIFSYPGATPSEEMLQLIKDGLVGGLIFFGENILSLAQISDVVTELKAAHAQSPTSATPLILTTDQEGGVVRRLRGQEPILSEKQVGASADPLAEATKAGNGAGLALKNVGMNLNLAPVEDVYREEGNFDDQFGRSYSSDPAVCGTLGAAFVRAQQATGVAATAKHYPGLGWATRAQNTDLGIVTLNQPAAEIRAVDEFAFTPVIKAGVQLVMTSWATYPAIDPDYPAGLSKTFVGRELRGRQHFRGVTITDALEAGALDPFGDTGERSVLSAEAGMDVLLCSGRDVGQGQDAVNAVTVTVTVTAALQSGRLNPGHFKIALRRVHRLRYSLGWLRRSYDLTSFFFARPPCDAARPGPARGTGPSRAPAARNRTHESLDRKSRIIHFHGVRCITSHPGPGMPGATDTEETFWSQVHPAPVRRRPIPRRRRDRVRCISPCARRPSSLQTSPCCCAR